MIHVTVQQPAGVTVNASAGRPAVVRAGGASVNLGGPNNYARLSNKPAINGHELREGENALEEIQERMAFSEVDALFR